MTRKEPLDGSRVQTTEQEAVPADEDPRGGVASATPGGTQSLTGTREQLRHLDVPKTLRRAESRRDSQRRRALALADLASLWIAAAIVFVASPLKASLSTQLAILALQPAWIVLNKLLGLYDRDANVIHKSTLDELPRILQSVLLGSALTYLCASLLDDASVGRSQALVFGASAAVLMPALRGAVRLWFNSRAEPERCLIVGSGAVAELLATKISKHPEYRVNVLGCVDDSAFSARNGHASLPLLGGLDDFDRVCAALDVERVLVSFTASPHEDLIRLLRVSKQLNLKVTVVPRLFEGFGDAIEVEQVEGLTLFGLRGLARTQSSLRLKRILDIAASAIGLLLLSPLLAVVAVAVKLDSRGSVLFRQRRIGRDNEPFDMFKFRTMHRGADELKESLSHLNESVAPMFKIAEDPRITRLGRFLRRHFLDELPQLFNVLLGNMSLVGPRPLIPSEDVHVIGPHRSRLDLTPGVTGPWQVMGRNEIPFPEMVKLDYLYVADWSLWNDIKLLIRTAPMVVRGRGH